MSCYFPMKLCIPPIYIASILALALAFLTSIANGQSPQSQWVYPGPDGKLIYRPTPRGDRIMDFSFAGYRGGGVALPDVPVARTVQPAGADDAAAIQAAIDSVSSLPIHDGFRGAVLLAPGDFTCSRTLNIQSDGVVLRGSGSGPGGSTIHMTGPRHRAIVIGRRSYSGELQSGLPHVRTTIADAYVPSGASSFTVANSRGLAVGETVSIRRPTTAAWVHFMGMDTLFRNGGDQTWIGVGRDEFTYRRISAIQGNRLFVDIPLPDSFDSQYLNPPGTLVESIPPRLRLEQVGVEHLHIQCPPLQIAYTQAPYSAISIGGDDCWVRDVYCQETMNDTVLYGDRITEQQVVCTHSYANVGASKPTDFSIEGSQELIDRCRIAGGNMYFVWTVSLRPGPNVVLNSIFAGDSRSRLQPHERWATGLLVDNCQVPGGGIDFCNRGIAGSGHGWTIGWSVAWNCVADEFVIQQPPGSANWAIGCVGRRRQRAAFFQTAPILPEGYVDSPNTPVAPRSLYLAQLRQRLGSAALDTIGYGQEFPAPPALPPYKPIPAPLESDPGQ